ncbi:hypothetical protein WMY93_001819 [Mugilogobius chulae]|uniref:NACHT domain-containing protein n=1 Tax=Mugilogobius chulae TaxID=88201 RepID=A0AAW0PRR2_9GOBI
MDEPEPGPSPNQDCLWSKAGPSPEPDCLWSKAGPSPEPDCPRSKAGPSPEPDCPRSKSGPGPSGVSLCSAQSKSHGISFKPGQSSSSLELSEITELPVYLDCFRDVDTSRPEPGLKQDFGPSGVSLSCDRAEESTIDFTDGQSSSPQLRSEDRSVLIGQEPQTELDSIFQNLETQVLEFVQQQLQRLRLLLSDHPQCSESEGAELSTEVLNISLDFLKKMDQEPLAQLLLNSEVAVCRDELKSHLQQKFSRVFEGGAKAADSAPLNQIYTELYITEGGASEVNQEHEVRLMESASRRAAAPEKTITCQDMFKPRPHSPQPIRAVLTVGVAGVGKTVLTQKFSLDWAEGRTNQELQLLFPFTFRELNVLRDTQFSLVQLLQHFFSPSKDLCSFRQLQVLFIFDGLDECRLPLDFSRTRVLTDPTESVSVDVLLVNLIRGSLLPSALLWITTRPAAANQIPAECVSMVTEVRGFTDLQKEQYFRKRFTDDTIISHIKSVRSLYIMSYIPIFCWILSTVLQKLLEQTEEPELPRTLTQMYVHFLVLQAKVKNIKYHQGSGADLHWTPETRDMVLSLSKLAFEQLQKGNLIFYQSDLSECGLDAEEAARYSGVLTQVFKEEPGLYQDKVYCFIHLSLQEFLAALHVHQTFYSSGLNLMETPHSSESPESEVSFYSSGLNLMETPHSSESPESEVSFYSSGLNLMETPHSSESPESEVSFYSSGLNLMETPHSSESPESEVSFYSSGLNLMETPHSSESPESEVSFYVSAVDQALQSPNGHLDLFLRFLLGLSLPTNQRLLQGLLTHTGSDTTNQETVKYIKQKLNEKSLSAERSLNLFHCLNELNDQSLVKEIQRHMRQRHIAGKDMSPADWSALSFVLLSSDSDLQEFDLRKYEASERALLGLLPVVKASTKALFLNMVNCYIHIEKTQNHEKQCNQAKSQLWKSPHCKCSLIGCGLSPHSCGPLSSVLSSSSLTHLDLSHNDLQDSGVELLCEGLKSAPCRLHTLRLSGCLVSERGGAALASALSSAHSRVTELDLSYNHPGPSAELLTALQRPLQSVRLLPAGERWMVPGLRKCECCFSFMLQCK